MELTEPSHEGHGTETSPRPSNRTITIAQQAPNGTHKPNESGNSITEKARKIGRSPNRTKLGFFGRARKIKKANNKGGTNLGVQGKGTTHENDSGLDNHGCVVADDNSRNITMDTTSTGPEVPVHGPPYDTSGWSEKSRENSMTYLVGSGKKKWFMRSPLLQLCCGLKIQQVFN